MQFTHINRDALYERIAVNIAYYRKLTGLTQTELAERLNYSDKSVSKWERAASAPDIFVLKSIAELFGITVNDLISENAPSPPPDPSLRQKRRVVIFFQFIALVWLLATTVFTVLLIAFPDIRFAWSAFVFAVPASAAVYVVFSAMWWGHLSRLLSVSALAWTTAACVFMLMLQRKFSFLVFTVCAVTQIIVLLWYFHGRLKEKR